MGTALWEVLRAIGTTQSTTRAFILTSPTHRRLGRTTILRTGLDAGLGGSRTVQSFRNRCVLVDNYVSVPLESAPLDFVTDGLAIGGSLSQRLHVHLRNRPGALTTLLPLDHDPLRLGKLHEGGMADVETSLAALSIYCNKVLLARGGMLVAEDPVRRRGNSHLSEQVAYYDDEVYWYGSGSPDSSRALRQVLRMARGPVHGTFAICDRDVGDIVGPLEWSQGDLEQIVATTWLVGMPAYDGETSVIWQDIGSA